RSPVPSSSFGTATFSQAVSVGSRLKNWKTKPTLWRRNSACRSSGSRPISSPWKVMDPESGVSSDRSRCSSVLLPEPEGPMIEVNSPGSIRRSTPSSARTRCPPIRYSLVTPDSSSMAGSDMGRIPPLLRWKRRSAHRRRSREVAADVLGVEQRPQRGLFGAQLPVHLLGRAAVRRAQFDLDVQMVAPSVAQGQQQTLDAAEETVQIRQSGEQIRVGRVDRGAGEHGTHDLG